MNRKNLIFVKNEHIDSLLLKVVEKELLDIPSIFIGKYLTEQINKALDDINTTNEFITLTQLANRYVVLLMLRRVNNNSSTTIINNISPDVEGEQVILSETYVSYMYEDGVWKYSCPGRGVAFDIKLSTKRNSNHNKLCKILSLAYPTKMPIKPYIIPPNVYDEAMVSLINSALSNYRGVDKTDTSIMKSLVDAYVAVKL